MSFDSKQYLNHLLDEFYDAFIGMIKQKVDIYQQQGREIRNLSYLSKRLQGNQDVISAITAFLIKDDPYANWKTWDELYDKYSRTREERLTAWGRT
jgi:predicted alpha/beta hydrolase